MGTIRVEAVPVKSYNLGLFRFDHLQLVYQDETDVIDSQDYWYVLEGIQDGPLFSSTLGASGENGSLSLGVSNDAGRDELISIIGTPEMRGSRIIASGSTAFSTWSQLTAYAGEIEDQQYPYVAYSLPFSVSGTINSTSLISSALWSVGIDLNNVMPFSLRLSPGAETILGTAGDDDMRAAGNFTTVATGLGNDTLRGSTNTIWLEKLFGGAGDDTFHWSLGDNVVNGGQVRMAYINDGLDTMDYSGIGAVYISTTEHAVEHKIADYFADFEGGSDQLFSIEQVSWDSGTDVVESGPGVDLFEKPVRLDLQGDSGGRGDELSMAGGNASLLVNVSSGGMISVQALANEGLDAGFWVSSLEWFAGSKGNDEIYTGGSMRGAEGGDGDDLIDTRLTEPFSGQSPNGYDIEIDGGEGDDTLVAGSGRTFAAGGNGADMFVLSAMSSGVGTIELVIDDADSSDKLYIPYDLFTVTRGDYEGSSLFQLTGGVFKIDDAITRSYFYWGDSDDDQVQGNISFVGNIFYEMEGSDLVISILQGHQESVTIDYGPGEPPGPTVTYAAIEENTLSIVRVSNWSEGMLGITFPVTWDVTTAGEGELLSDYPGYQSAVSNATQSSRFISGLDERPESHTPREFGTAVATARSLAPPVTDGTAGDDIIIADHGGPYHISGGAGDDSITGSDGGDEIDGGTGADSMSGGRGNDAYHVDAAGDQVIEVAGGGFDKVYSFVDYLLGDFVEHVTLQGSATTATGNDLRNTLVGNDLNNILIGGGGSDTLAGNLGDDTLIGGLGGDGYVYELGDGRDKIIEVVEAGVRDVIVFAGELKASDVAFYRRPDTPLDLTLRFADGGSLTVVDYFSAAGPNIEAVEFASGDADWTMEQFADLAGNAALTANIAPIARDDVLAYAGGRSVVVPFAALLDNDTDQNGDQLTVLSLANVIGGTAVLDGHGGIVVDSASGPGHVSFDYTVSDGQGGTAKATFDVSMVPNSAPRLTSGTVSTIVEDTAAAGRLIASDDDGDTIIYAVKAGAGPAKGTIVFAEDGHFVYTPHSNANGPDSFTLTVSDGLSAAVEQAFAVSIAAINDAPIAQADQGFSLQSGATLQLAAASILGNDTDIDGDLLALASVSAISGGTVVRTADGGVSFTATTGYTGAASFAYTVSDGHGGTSSSSVALNVTPAPPGPATPNMIIGTDGRDVLIGTSGNDIFIGKAGSDTFVFRRGIGHDQINDFQTGSFFANLFGGTKDVIDLRGAGFTGIFDFLNHMSKSGSDTLITTHDGGSILVKNVTPNHFFFDNFKLF